MSALASRCGAPFDSYSTISITITDMDFRALRTDFGTVAQTAGFNAYDYEPDDPGALPAAVVGGVRSLRRLTMSGTCEVELEITLYVSAADPQDATATLDLALSLGLSTSLLSILEAVDPILDKPSWRSARFVTAGPYQRVAMPGGGAALACSVVVEFTA